MPRVRPGAPRSGDQLLGERVVTELKRGADHRWEGHCVVRVLTGPRVGLDLREETPRGTPVSNAGTRDSGRNQAADNDLWVARLTEPGLDPVEPSGSRLALSAQG